MKQQVIRKRQRRLDISLLTRLRSLPAYLRDSGVPVAKKGALLLAALYVVLPFDFDWVPVLGWLDDLGVIGAVTMWLMNDLERYVASRREAPPPDAPPPPKALRRP